MAITATPAGSLAETVKNETNSPSTTTPLTLKLLRTLLGLNDPINPVLNPASKPTCDATPRPTSVKKVQPKASSKTAKPIYPREPAKFVIYTIPETSTSLSTDAQKLTLATETFNKTLKHLSDAARSRKTTEAYPNNISCPISPSSRLIRPSDGRPLHETSPNRQSRTPSIPKVKQTLNANLSASDPGVLTTAQCAQAALDCLRGLEERADSKAENFQLEQGSLALLESLNTLKFSDLAIQEIHVLKARLDHKIRTGNRSSTSCEETARRPPSWSIDVLAQCLRFDVIPTSERHFKLIISFQKQVLKTVASSPPAALPDNLVEALQYGCKYGPYAIIIEGYHSMLLSAEKASLQLQTLAQAVSSLCFSVLSAGSKAAGRAPSSPPAKICQLQLVALELQCSSWNLTKSPPNLDRTVWAAFMRVVKKFCQTSGVSNSEQYVFAKGGLERLSLALQTTFGSRTMQSGIQIPVFVTDYVAKLAQDCGCHADSIHILRRSLEALNTEGLASVICRCNIATLQLQSFSDNPPAVLVAAEEALTSLRGSLKGSQRELEDMLLHGVRLRKAAFDTLCKLGKSVELRPPVDVHLQLRSYSIKLIFAVLNFVYRYIGRPVEDGGGSPEKMERFQQKLRLARSIAETTVNNTLTAARLAVDTLATTWGETDSALNECLALTRTLQQATDPTVESDTSQTTPSAFLKVSNIYWSQFLMTRGNSDSAELIVLLNNSIRALEGRPESERRVGYLAIKYEKIASLYTDLHQHDKAKEALRGAIAIHISYGPFKDVVGTRHLHSMRCAWDSESSTIFAFGKTLSAIVKLHILSSPAKPPHLEYYDDDETLSSEDRVALLQRQFITYTVLNPSTSKPASIGPLARLILGLCSQYQGLQRVQLLLSALKYASKHQDNHLEDLLEEQLSGDMLSDLESDLTKTSSSTSYGLALFTSLRLQWAFKRSRPTPQLLNEMVEAWSSLTSEFQDWLTFESHLEDPGFLSSQIQAVVDYADMQGLSRLRLNALGLQQRMLDSQKPKDYATLATILVRKSLQSSRLGMTSDASGALASAKQCLDSLGSAPLISLEYHLALAEHLLNTSKFEAFVQAFEVAHSIHEAIFNNRIENADHRFSSSEARLLCQCASLASRWELGQGDLTKAVFRAKQNVKLSSQIWAGMQKMFPPRHIPTAIETNESTLDSLVHDMSNMSISNTTTNERSATRGAAYWPYVGFHCEALVHLSYLLASCGLYQDAIYFGDQAHRVAQAVGSSVYIFTSRALLWAHRRKANDIDAGLEVSDARLPPPPPPPLDIEYAGLGLVSSFVYLAEASISAGDLSSASEAVAEAMKLLSRLDSQGNIFQTTAKIGKLPADSVDHNLTGSKAKTRTGTSSRNTRKAVQANSTKLRSRKRPTSNTTGNFENEATVSTAFANFEFIIDVLKAHIALNLDEDQDASSVLAKCKDVNHCSQEDSRRPLLEARTMLRELFKRLSADAVYCVLAETTIAFPSLQKERPPGNQIVPKSAVASRVPSRARRRDLTSRQKPAHQQKECEEPSDLAVRAAELLLKTLSHVYGGCPMDMLRELSLMLNECHMLSSVLLGQGNYTPVQVALQAAVPNSLAMAREGAVAAADITWTDRSKTNLWPEIRHSGRGAVQLTSAHASSIEPGCLDKLPQQWTVVSIQLGKTRDEISFTKFHVDQPPFSLRIPLRRSSSDEAEDMDFGFAEAQIELREIIKLANKTAHDSGSQGDKQAKKMWWTEREALDDRLKVLLENIENIWLGGFRGILAHQHRHPDLLSRLSGSLLQSLNQHLPSRQKSRQSAGAELRLHPHVLDLFVALGHPDERNLDESIADLLYFVVDILQFQGEHNAYDEIDFDMITIEVVDALRCYHEALRGFDVERTQHTILVLDKELLAFPWESLPCLDGRPISRMPSITCIQSRLEKMRLQDVDASAMSISANKGAYILNPSSDLLSTQSTFGAVFGASLPTFTSIINRVPTEAEFESYLREKELFLYFGHGSGAQYIRGRTIKRLRRCAVTFLMGCSSGKMVECGEFEPYGVPRNYMHANAPAVVGTLWDVTDKDIDRFAMKTFTEWGLIPEEAVAEEAAGRKKKGKNVQGKAKSRKPPDQHRLDGGSANSKVALDEAVANARSSCVLRYLNGAAPVIYGIPIVLEH